MFCKYAINFWAIPTHILFTCKEINSILPPKIRQTFPFTSVAQYSAALKSFNHDEVKYILILLKGADREFNAAYNNTTSPQDRNAFCLLKYSAKKPT